MQMIAHRTVVSLVSKEYITPNFLRVILHCDDIEHYKDTPLGVNNKLFIPPNGDTTVQIPTYNPETKIWEMADEAKKPTTRTYTHRAINLDKKQLTVDFAVHDGDSIACNWARDSKPGDEVGLAMKLKHRDALPAGIKNFLFVTDMTGIPVVAALAASLPEDAHVHIITEVLSEADIFEEHYQSKASLNIEWLVNNHPENGSELADLAKAAWEKIEQPNFTHITAEYNVVKTLRDFLRHDNGKTSQDFFACAYWQVNKKEDEERVKRME